ncbi:rod shape-determining protein MreB [Clostridium cylindrosporum]|uniref:Cell shape-determining protein MreB n=1 Tax=Clostridium cylindrosporum DSM 605 TaxID=1121307 RepID=A0A0J8G525_CLOCY|nr:rod shape-determining protein MreB [Clostridium cylindrosporum]KMT22771.1 cell shape determining protein, MreB/Mrl family [Clostridium cylindrosporum DSM 605]
MFGAGNDIGIDLGTASVLVYVKGRGIALQEPSVVALDMKSNKVLAVGEDARNMIGRTPGHIVAKRPLRDGVISDYDMTEQMLVHFIKKAIGKRGWSKPRVIICIPCEATGVERRAVKDAALNAGARSVYLIEEPISAAIGAGVDISKPSGSMIVDIGGGTTDVAVISLGGMVVRSSIKVAGDKFDEAIMSYIRREHKVMIGERTAEELKKNVGCAFKRDDKVTMDVKGRDLVSGLPKNITITSDEMGVALKDTVEAIADCVHSVLEKTPPELSADISEKGIIMTGGGSLLWGLDKLIEERTMVPVVIADDAVSSVALGIGKSLDHVDTFVEDISAI